MESVPSAAAPTAEAFKKSRRVALGEPADCFPGTIMLSPLRGCLEMPLPHDNPAAGGGQSGPVKR